MTGFDRSLYLAAFAEEVQTHLSTLDSGLMALEKGAATPEIIREMFRAAHTVKGNARMMGFEHLAELAHALENVLEAVRSDRITLYPQTIDPIFQTVDTMRYMTSAYIADAPPPPAAVSLLEALDRLQNPPEPPSEEPGTSPLADQKSATVELAMPASQLGDAALLSSQPSTIPGAMEGTLAPTPAPIAAMPVMPTPDATAAELPASEVSPLIQVEVARIDGIVGLAGELALCQVRRRGLEAQLEELLAPRDRWNGQHVGVWTRESGEAALLALRAMRSLDAEIDRLVVDLREEGLRARLVPVGVATRGLPRLVRDLARDELKQVRLDLRGVDLLLDKPVVDALASPLGHLVRNAVHHGIEAPPVRAAAGKPQEGTVRVTAYVRGDRACIEVADDGAGVNLAKVREAAFRSGYLPVERASMITDDEALRLILVSGVSTAPIVTQTSGRGVGIDVVQSVVDHFKGQLEIDNVPGKGASFTLIFPLATALDQLFLMDAAGLLIAIPATPIVGIWDQRDLGTYLLAGKPMVELEGRSIPLLRMAQIMGASPSNGDNNRNGDIVIVSESGREVALAVDAALDEVSTVVRPLGPMFAGSGWFSGGAILMDGRVALVARVSELLSAAEHQTIVVDRSLDSTKPRPGDYTVLIVDDSALLRGTLEQAILTTAGYNVILAFDALDGLDKLSQNDVQLIITDVEMPHMDGFEFTALVRRSSEWKNLPIVIVSTRERAEDKRRGIEVGAQAYITKSSFDQSILLETVQRFLA